ncbi:MAG: hypothetical protein ABIK31_01635 [candidate division WOR-3 bacterium]
MSVGSFLLSFKPSDRASLEEIKILSKSANPDIVNNYLQSVESIVPILVDSDLVSTTVFRNSYWLNKMIRKRNGMYSVLGKMMDSFEATSPFFSLFNGYSQDVARSADQANAPVNSLVKKYQEYKYKTKKYATNAYTFERVSANELQYKSYINSFRKYFFE